MVAPVCVVALDEHPHNSEATTESHKSSTLLFLKRHSTLLFALSSVFMVCAGTALLVFTLLGAGRHNEEWFWIGLVIKNVVILMIEYVLGLGVIYRAWHVGYTRKTVHVTFFLFPFLMDIYMPLPEEDSWLWASWNVYIICIMLFMITKPVRRTMPFIATLYAAVDRPEDKGLTQVYTIAQVPASMVVIAGFSVIFNEVFDRPEWTLCPIIAVTFGDGLAEPVAVFWEQYKLCGGTHKYKSRGLCSNKVFTRSLEGSATVFIFTVASVLMLYRTMSVLTQAFLLAILPLTMTLLETVAPHSLDNPFLLAWGYVILCIAHLVEIAT